MLARISRKKLAATFLPVAILLIAACSGTAAPSTSSPIPTEPPASIPVIAEPQATAEISDISQTIPISADTTEVAESVPEPLATEAPTEDSTEASAKTEEPDSPEPQMTSALEDLSDDQIVAAYENVFSSLYENVLPSVVQISVAQEIAGSGFPFGQIPDGQNIPDFFSSGEGSGFVWSKEGYIATNRHVIEDADLVLVRFADGTQTEAEVIGSDADSDLAVIKVDLPEDKLSPVLLGSSGDTQVGQFAAAIGNPFGQEFTMTTGIVSAVGRTINSGNSQFSIPEVIQTDAAINPGNSGGPLLNRSGEVIGINTQIISESGSSSGVGFAVPVDVAKRVVPALIQDGFFEYSWLGISGASITPDIASEMNLPEDTKGAHIIEIAEGGPADDAGLKGSDRTRRTDLGNVPVGGDVVIAIDGAPITDMDDLISYLVVNTKPGDIVTFEVLRDGGESANIDVTLGARPR